MGSLFVVVCPTKDHEEDLRRRDVNITSSLEAVAKKEENIVLKVASIHKKNKSSLVIAGFATDDEETLSKTHHRMESKISASDIQSIIQTIYLEKYLEDTMKKFSIYHAAVCTTVDNNMFQVTFTAAQSKTEKIIQHLQTCGFGTKYESSICVSGGHVYIVDESYLHKERKNEDTTTDNSSDEEDEDQLVKKKGKWNDFVSSIKSRLTVAQVVQSVTSSAAITFDYMMLILVAALVAALGLLENNSVNLVASMLISPLMSPIMAFVFSCVISDRNLMKLGTFGACLGLLQCLVVGLITGISIESKPFRGPWADVTEWPTGEMISRSQKRALIVGAFVAIPSGVGVALSILAGNSGSLVGVAISASLLPPAVNCGVFWGMSIVVAIQESNKNGNINVDCDQYLGKGGQSTYYFGNYEPVYCKNAVKEYAMMGTMSLLLTIINIILIFVFGIIILRIKEFAPYTTRKNLHRFWKEDLKNVREYNATHGGVLREEDILKDINAVANPDELRNNLENDATLNTINLRTGRTIHDVKLGRTQKPIDELSVQNAPPTGQTTQAGWLSWFKKSETIPEEPTFVAPEKRVRRILIKRNSY